MAHILKICAIWVQIWTCQNVRKNTAEPSIRSVFQYFDEKVHFGVIMSQNWPKISKLTGYSQICVPVCVKSSKCKIFWINISNAVILSFLEFLCDLFRVFELCQPVCTNFWGHSGAPFARASYSRNFCLFSTFEEYISLFWLFWAVFEIWHPGKRCAQMSRIVGTLRLTQLENSEKVAQKFQKWQNDHVRNINPKNFTLWWFDTHRHTNLGITY